MSTILKLKSSILLRISVHLPIFTKSSMDPRKVRNILRTEFVVRKPCSPVFWFYGTDVLFATAHTLSHKRYTGVMERPEERAISCLPCRCLSSWSSTSCLLMPLILANNTRENSRTSVWRNTKRLDKRVEKILHRSKHRTFEKMIIQINISKLRYVSKPPRTSLSLPTILNSVNVCSYFHAE